MSFRAGKSHEINHLFLHTGRQHLTKPAKQCELLLIPTLTSEASHSLTVVNSGGAAVAMPTVVDRINVPDNVQISSLTTTPVAATTSPPTGPYSGTNIDITWTGLTETLPAFSWVQLTVTFTILDAPTEGAVITDVDAGIGQLSGTPQYTCTIPVKKTPPPPPPPPSRGLSINDFIITTRRFPE